MGNTFTAEGSGAGDLSMTNGGTDAFYDVLTLAACAIAETPWELNLAVDLADGQRHSRGFAGHDLSEWPWTGDWRREKAFLLRVIDLAEARHGWDRLDYEPARAPSHLRDLRAMVEGLTPLPMERPPHRRDWTSPPPPGHLERCPEHDVFEGQFGCRLCSDW
ncbi:hypothetical protein [Actinomadura kijaniata]|uniref:hypothetical protein n=1 Tax=Actinomadura kijaniata TaxID=46161 RepID=UPI00082E7D9C|nr:hypothetical protein [Actinomadura kijaniata]